MPAIELSITTTASRQSVWDELRHIDRHVHWMHDADAITFATEQREGVGTTFTCRTKVGPFVTNDVMTITEWVDATAMSVRHQGIITGEGRFSLSERGGATVVTWYEALTFPAWALGAIGAWCAAPLLRFIWRRNLTNLVGIVEQPQHS